MTADSLIAFNLVLLAALASPGAALLFCMRTTVVAGRRAGMLTGLGLGLAAAFWTLAALLGLEGIFILFPWAYGALKIGGALYLLWIAYTTWRHARAPLEQAAGATRRNLMAGLFVNLGNPKSMLFAAAVIVVVFPQALSGAEIAFVALNHLVLEVLFYTLLAMVLGAPAARRRYLSLKPVLDRIAATLLAGLGLRLLLEK